MEPKIHYSDFASLRRAYTEIKKLVEDKSGYKKITLRTSIDRDLGIAGDDIGELFNDFIDRYRLDANGFEFSKYFLSEGELFDNGASILWVLMLPVMAVIGIVQLLSTGKIKLPFHLPDPDRDMIDLTFADMIVWQQTGSFNTRQQVRILLANQKYF